MPNFRFFDFLTLDGDGTSVSSSIPVPPRVKLPLSRNIASNEPANSSLSEGDLIASLTAVSYTHLTLPTKA